MQTSTTRLDLNFDGHVVPCIRVGARWAWPALTLGRAIGYSGEGRAISRAIHDLVEKAELIAQRDYDVLRGEPLAAAKAVMENMIAPSATALTVVYESGIHGLLVHTRKRRGRELRRRLMDEILPQLARDGRYAPERKVVDGTIVPKGRTPAPLEAHRDINPANIPLPLPAEGSGPTLPPSSVGLELLEPLYRADAERRQDRRTAVAHIERAAELAKGAGASARARYELYLQAAELAGGIDLSAHRGALNESSASTSFEDEETVERPITTGEMVEVCAQLCDDEQDESALSGWWMPDLAARVIGLLRCGPRTRRQLATELGEHTARVRIVLHELVAEGKLEATSRQGQAQEFSVCR